MFLHSIEEKGTWEEIGKILWVCPECGSVMVPIEKTQSLKTFCAQAYCPSCYRLFSFVQNKVVK